MNTGEAEREAERLLDRLGASGAPRMTEVAHHVLGAKCLSTVPPAALPGDGALAVVNGVRRIFVRSGLSVPALRWVIAHELGHAVLGLDSSSLHNEALCDAFAAALVAPRKAYAAALECTGPSYGKLAQWFLATESCVALRLGEVTGKPLALITPHGRMERGAACDWSAVLQRGHAGLRTARLKDDRRRVALRLVG